MTGIRPQKVVGIDDLSGLGGGGRDVIVHAGQIRVVSARCRGDAGIDRGAVGLALGPEGTIHDDTVGVTAAPQSRQQMLPTASPDGETLLAAVVDRARPPGRGGVGEIFGRKRTQVARLEALKVKTLINQVDDQPVEMERLQFEDQGFRHVAQHHATLERLCIRSSKSTSTKGGAPTPARLVRAT